MDRPDADKPRTPAPGFSLLRPAVPPRAAESPARRLELDRALGPFAPGRESPPVAPGAPPPPDLSGIVELPWSALDAPRGEKPDPAKPSYDYEVDEISLGDEAEWLEYEAGAEAPMAEDALEPLAEAAEPGQEPLVGEELLAPPEWEYGFAHSADAEPEEAPAALAPSAGPAQSHALEDVAARLEQIAKSLRGRSPTELLSGAHDPLQVLIAGYALGLEAARAAQEHSTRDE